MNRRNRKQQRKRRRGVTMVLAVFLIFIVGAMIAFAVDIGFIVLVRTQLQAAADSSAMAAAASMGLPREEMVGIAEEYAGYHQAGGEKVLMNSQDVEYGLWDPDTRTFTPTEEMGNAVRVTTRANNAGGGGYALFFGKLFNRFSFPQTASAVAMANPRDIAFVVDLSGSMNNDTEPCWATDAINDTFGPEGYPTVGTELMQQLYDDFGYGSYPGTLQYIGEPLGVSQDSSAYAELTDRKGPLSKKSIPRQYRISSGDSESTRKRKAYSAMIDYQIARVMPNARPTPDSTVNYAYWEKYLDYIIQSTYVRSRGRLPPNQDYDRIDRFGNPSSKTFPQVSRSVPRGFRNKIGYRTYVQFMMDYGRDLKPDGRTYVPLSQYSPDCPWHWEDTPGGAFRFPPRAQPMHAARRALIAAIQVIKERNESISNLNQRDWVSVVAFDTLTGGGPVVIQPLTGDYDAAMQSCTTLQAVGDKGASTATESGLIKAKEHVQPMDDGGQGRLSTNKFVVLLTDGVPNLYSSSRSEISSYVAQSDSPDFYGSYAYAYNASLMQAMMMQANNSYVFPVGVGLGTDYDFMDRLASAGATADDDGRSPRGSGNPAAYEQRLTDIFEEIITNPKVRLVQ